MASEPRMSQQGGQRPQQLNAGGFAAGAPQPGASQSQSQSQSQQQSVGQPKKEKRKPIVLGPLPLDPVPPDNISLRPGAQFTSRRAVQEAIDKRAHEFGFPVVFLNRTAAKKQGLASDKSFHARLRLGCFRYKNVSAGDERCPWLAKIKIRVLGGGKDVWEIEEITNEHNHGRFKDLGEWSPPLIKVPVPLPKKQGDHSRSQRRPCLADPEEEDATSGSEEEGIEYRPHHAKAFTSAKRRRSPSPLRSPSPDVDPDYQFNHPFSAYPRGFSSIEAFHKAARKFAAEEGLKLWNENLPKSTAFTCVTKSGRGVKRGTGACAWRIKVVKYTDGRYYIDEDESEFVHTGHDLKEQRRTSDDEDDAGGDEEEATPAGPSQPKSTPPAAAATASSSKKRNGGAAAAGAPRERSSAPPSAAKGSAEEKREKKQEKDVENEDMIDLTAQSDGEEEKPVVVNYDRYGRLLKREATEEKPSPSSLLPTLSSALTLEDYLAALAPDRALDPTLSLARFANPIRALQLDLKDVKALPAENAVKFVELLLVELGKSEGGATAKDELESDILLTRLKQRGRGGRA
ncbi:hypothetical protein JCM6882_008711 [Rhodosporidiobolus microsporus]